MLQASRIEELQDDLMMQILCKLPCKTVHLCKCVSRRWHQLISKPTFPIFFLNHTRKIVAATGTRWTTIMLRMKNKDINWITFNDQGELVSPNITLKFLPYDHVEVAATLKDLVLCYDIDSRSRSQSIEYTICNPLTMEWLTLPPSPPLEQHYFSTSLICQEPHYINRSYDFRVVIVKHPRNMQEMLEVFVFCSEEGKWKQIGLTPRTLPSSSPFYTCKPDDIVNDPFEGAVVCNKKLYFRYRCIVWEFDPFSVTNATRDGTILSSPTWPLRTNNLTERCMLAECHGKLLVIKADIEFQYGRLSMRKLRTDVDTVVEQNTRVWDDVGFVLFRRLIGIIAKTDPTKPFRVVGVHPSLSTTTPLVSLFVNNHRLRWCDVRSEQVWSLRFPIPPGSNLMLQVGSLDLPSSPTPLPVWDLGIPRIDEGRKTVQDDCNTLASSNIVRNDYQPTTEIEVGDDSGSKDDLIDIVVKHNDQIIGRIHRNQAANAKSEAELDLKIEEIISGLNWDSLRCVLPEDYKIRYETRVYPDEARFLRVAPNNYQQLVADIQRVMITTTSDRSYFPWTEIWGPRLLHA